MDQEAQVTFMGQPVEFVPSVEDAAGRTYVFNPDAKIGPHTAVEFLEAMAGRPVFRINCDHLGVVYSPPPVKRRHGVIRPLPGQLGGGPA